MGLIVERQRKRNDRRRETAQGTELWSVANGVVSFGNRRLSAFDSDRY